jgi:mRNA interferase HigB
MRIIARSTVVDFWVTHPETRAALTHWLAVAKASSWPDTNALRATFSKAKVLNGERVRFEVAGGDYRMIVAFDFGRQIAFIKFVGTHAEYDRINALSVSLF